MTQKTTTEPRYSLPFRYKEDVKKGLQKIMARKKIKSKNEAICLSIIKFANELK